MYAIQVDVRKTESRFLMKNVVALCQDRSPRIHDLLDRGIGERSGDERREQGC